MSPSRRRSIFQMTQWDLASCGTVADALESLRGWRRALGVAACGERTGRSSRPVLGVAAVDPLLHGVDAVADYSGESDVLGAGAGAAPVGECAGGDLEVLGELGGGEELREFGGGNLRARHGGLRSSSAPWWRPRFRAVGGEFPSRAIMSIGQGSSAVTIGDAPTMLAMPAPMSLPRRGDLAPPICLASCTGVTWGPGRDE